MNYWNKGHKIENTIRYLPFVDSAGSQGLDRPGVVLEVVHVDVVGLQLPELLQLGLGDLHQAGRVRDDPLGVLLAVGHRHAPLQHAPEPGPSST